LDTSDRHIGSRTRPHFGRDRTAVELERKQHDDLGARMGQRERSFTTLSHSDNTSKQQTDVNLPMVKPLSSTG
jgi:hypothetical protein